MNRWLKIVLAIGLLASVWARPASGGLTETIIANLPTSGPAGMARIITDGTTDGTCTSGGGKYVVLCIFDGVSTWTTGGGGAAGGITKTGTPASGQLSFFTGSATISGDANLTWDNTAKTLSLGTGNAVTITNATLTGARTFTLPDANSNPVVPSTCATNTWASGVSSAGVISCVGYPLLGTDGSASAPTYSFAGATGLGMYRNTGNFLAFAASGSIVMQMSGNGLSLLNGSSLVPVVTNFASGSSGFYFPTSSDTFGLANSTDGEWCRWLRTAYQCSRGSADAVGYEFDILKSRGTVAAPTVITTGDAIFPLCGKVYVGATNTYLKVACIELDSTGTIADTTSGAGGTIKFQTTKAGTDTAVQTAYTITGGSTPTHTFVGTIIPTSTTGIQGTTTNDSASAGSIGEYVTATVATGSSVTLTTNTTANVTSISLTAGDWDVTCAVDFTFGATTSYTNLVGGVSTTSATLGGQDTKFDFETPAAVPTAGADSTFVCPPVRQSLSGTTTVFLVAQGTFTVSTLKAYGTIRARRVR